MGILDNYCDKHWQKQQLRMWRAKHRQSETLQLFNDRIARHNRKASAENPLIPPGAGGMVLGSIGAVDCTFSVRPRVGDNVYRDDNVDPSEDPMYSEYIKAHAYKLSVITSHATPASKELLLHVSVHYGGSVSDSTACSFHQRNLIESKILDGSFLLGDHAYLFDKFVLPPYANTSISIALPSERPGMRQFNASHSSDRVAAEHGICLLKQWGVIRGRSDMRLFSSVELFISAVRVCWGLTNFFRIHSAEST